MLLTSDKLGPFSDHEFGPTERVGRMDRKCCLHRTSWARSQTMSLGQPSASAYGWPRGGGRSLGYACLAQAIENEVEPTRVLEDFVLDEVLQ